MSQEPERRRAAEVSAALRVLAGLGGFQDPRLGPFQEVVADSALHTNGVPHRFSQLLSEVLADHGEAFR